MASASTVERIEGVTSELLCYGRCPSGAIKEVRFMECLKEKNMKDCNCSYEPCSRKGVCCECLRYHRSHGAIPACYFPAGAEETYDRSIENFIRVYQQKRG